ncbi:hypothetical protein ACFVYA_13750 [Amycolatopsis sp. NPDC058278]|uniref:hypothetical protein n=1 Tax=Amycolatopsis sp. NPDC058278 TaxID=3346417 RepID=UPI0036DEF67C
MSLLEKSDPVTIGNFVDGPDTMLWNPALTTKRWRAEVFRAFLRRAFSIRCVAGLLAFALVLGFDVAESLTGALTIGGGIALALSGLADAVITAASLATDHQHKPGQRCRLERSPGEFFLRSHDFADLDEAASQTAGLLVDLTGELHDTSARDWLDPELSGRVHQIVWDALTRLSRTGAARRHAARLAVTQGESDLAATIMAAIAEFDALLGELVFHLQGCVTLTREWEAKLRHAELLKRTTTVCSELEAASVRPVVVDAVELPCSVFAYVTAARDLTEAGPFPWERSPAEPVR